MNLVDALVIAFACAFALIGYDRGLVRSAPPLAGFVAGAAIGGCAGPALLAGGSESAYAPVVTVLCGLLGGAILAVLLEGVGFALRERMRAGPALEALDRLGGAALLAALALLVSWAFGAVALHSPSPRVRGVRTAVQDSAILRALNDLMPPSGPLLNVLRRIDPTPSVRGPRPQVPPPVAGILRAPGVIAAGQSVVKVLGTSCGLGIEGSGWVAGPGLVVTNAHVVAGESDTTVTPRRGSALDATVVRFDPRNDIAILRVPGLALRPLPLARHPRRGTPGAVLGFPENGPFTAAPARIGGTGTVISENAYGQGPVERAMTPFRGEVRSGNSGGPVVDARGRVLTTVFAAQESSRAPGGLGVPNSITAPALRSRLAPTGTGPCIG